MDRVKDAGRQSSAAEAEGWSRLFALVGSVVLAGVLLIFLQPILVPFVLAIFLAYLVRPFAEFISVNLCNCRRRRHGQRGTADARNREEIARLLPDEERAVPPFQSTHTGTLRNIENATQQIEAALPHWVGVVLAMSLAVVLFASIIVLMAASMSSLGSRLDAYQHRARELWSIIVFQLQQLGLNLAEVSYSSQAISSSLAPLLNASLSLLNDFLLVLIFLVFLLLEPSAPRSSLRKRVDDSISRYIIMKSLICFSMAAFTFIVLTLLQFPLALFLGIATYILTFIPNLGPLIACLLPLPICLLDVTVPRGAAFFAFFLPGVAHVMVGNILEPQLFGSQFRMSPVIILFSIGVWWILWGIVGAMLAVPLTSVLRIITSDVLANGDGGPYLYVLNSLLEGRPLDVLPPGSELPAASAHEQAATDDSRAHGVGKEA